MTVRERFRDQFQPIYFLGQNPVTLTGAVVATSTALTTIAFWFYDIFLPGPPHPYIGLLVFLILPGVFVLGLLLIPLGIWIRRRSLRGSGKLPEVFPAVDLLVQMLRKTGVVHRVSTWGNQLSLRVHMAWRWGEQVIMQSHQDAVTFEHHIITEG